MAGVEDLQRVVKIMSCESITINMPNFLRSIPSYSKHMVAFSLSYSFFFFFIIFATASK
jgi:hypothetical protein